MLFEIFLILTTILGILWMLDAFITLKVLKKHPEKEVNILLKDIYRHSPLAFLMFKLLDLILVITILYLLSINYIVTAETILLIFIYIYAKVDYHNYKIWKKLKLKGIAKEKAIKKELKERGLK